MVRVFAMVAERSRYPDAMGCGKRLEAIRRRVAEGSMIGLMTQVHITETELAQNLHAVLEKVRNGAEIVVEQDNRTVAVIRMPQAPGRSIDECIAIARARDSLATLDEGFAADLREIIADRKPLDTSAWE